eukprot:CAMPEP_0184500534 /NCGR_PEP_ID=MMETSP0113_2-20130426/45096_1 /TAXON_ID=91329 /ORGANISM="Norrisiella sphaerica, Strain BC52" /LENGTH=535 /DNA_ID=CAMNT_0026888951 /DNA_START=104 /DNA_END=1711 /DNA_ORIENTATION=+
MARVLLAEYHDRSTDANDDNVTTLLSADTMLHNRGSKNLRNGKDVREIYNPRRNPSSFRSLNSSQKSEDHLAYAMEVPLRSIGTEDYEGEAGSRGISPSRRSEMQPRPESREQTTRFTKCRIEQYEESYDFGSPQDTSGSMYHSPHSCRSAEKRKSNSHRGIARLHVPGHNGSGRASSSHQSKSRVDAKSSRKGDCTNSFKPLCFYYDQSLNTLQSNETISCTPQTNRRQIQLEPRRTQKDKNRARQNGVRIGGKGNNVESSRHSSIEKLAMSPQALRLLYGKRVNEPKVRCPSSDYVPPQWRTRCVLAPRSSSSSVKMNTAPHSRNGRRTRKSKSRSPVGAQSSASSSSPSRRISVRNKTQNQSVRTPAIHGNPLLSRPSISSSHEIRHQRSASSSSRNMIMPSQAPRLPLLKRETSLFDKYDRYDRYVKENIEYLSMQPDKKTNEKVRTSQTSSTSWLNVKKDVRTRNVDAETRSNEKKLNEKKLWDSHALSVLDRNSKKRLNSIFVPRPRTIKVSQSFNSSASSLSNVALDE